MSAVVVCFVGSPGAGKTTLIRSLADMLEDYVHFSSPAFSNHAEAMKQVR